MAEVQRLPEQRSWLCDIRLFRRADGSVEAQVADMPERLIETTGSEVPDRTRIIADWCFKGAGSLTVSATAFDVPANDGGSAHG